MPKQNCGFDTSDLHALQNRRFANYLSRYIALNVNLIVKSKMNKYYLPTVT